MMTADVLFAAAEPGGANVLASFHAGAKGRYAPPRAWATPAASGVLETAGLAVERLSASPSAAEVERRWAALKRPPAVLTGTSLDGTLEATLWRLAARDGVPALAWLDQWMNLDRRFRRGRPAWVAALDEAQRDALKAIGFDGRRIILGGHPHLRAVLTRSRTVMAHAKREAKDIVLFASESYTDDYRLGRLDPLGFDEHDVFDVVARGVEAAALAKPGRGFELVVKFHPLEGTPPHFIKLLESRSWPANVRCRWLAGEASGRDAAAEADLVVGMSSMLLIEAVLMGKPVLSLMPGLKGEDPFIASRLGAVLFAHERDAGIELVRRALTEPGFRVAALERQRRFLASLPPDGSPLVAAWLESASADAVG